MRPRIRRFIRQPERYRRSRRSQRGPGPAQCAMGRARDRLRAVPTERRARDRLLHLLREDRGRPDRRRGPGRVASTACRQEKDHEHTSGGHHDPILRRTFLRPTGKRVSRPPSMSGTSDTRTRPGFRERRRGATAGRTGSNASPGRPWPMPSRAGPSGRSARARPGAAGGRSRHFPPRSSSARAAERRPLTGTIQASSTGRTDLEDHPI